MTSERQIRILGRRYALEEAIEDYAHALRMEGQVSSSTPRYAPTAEKHVEDRRKALNEVLDLLFPDDEKETSSDASP